MPSFGSLFTAIGRMLPGFYEGERLAIQDNWNDLQNYNDVQSGQLDNAFKEASFEPRLNNIYYQAAVNELNARRHRADFSEYMAGHQGRLDREATIGANLGPLTAQEIGVLRAQMQRALQNPGGGMPQVNLLGQQGQQSSQSTIDPNTGLPVEVDPNTGLPVQQGNATKPSGI